MIPFFRKIRKQFADDNKPLKYMRYAIGEIVLVVIGILIALQINNWNINKQETKELHSYLKNIKNNLLSDLISIEEIKVNRDSSVAYSQNYLRIAKKDEITVDDFNTLENSKYKVQFDKYYKGHKSGFEALKNSGFIGKLNGTELERNLNEYYYLIDKINEKEESLNSTIENLEIVALTENVTIRLFEIHNNTKNKEAYIYTHQKEIKELLNFPSMKGANFRNRENTVLRQNYRQIEKIAHDLISGIDNTIKNHN